MAVPSPLDRRQVIQDALAVGAGFWLAGCASPRCRAAVAAPPPPAAPVAPAPPKGGEADVSPAEDLMREHGVLERVLLVYDEAVRRLEGRGDLAPETVRDAATLIQTFLEGYHEKLEEEHLFPRFRRAGTLVELVDVLEAQHQAGRRLTATTIALCSTAAWRDPADRARLVAALRAFVRMYAPHAAREDTVLFPAFRRLVSEREYDALGDEFEEREHALFGADGFEKNVERVASIEKTLGIHDLGRFTPRA